MIIANLSGAFFMSKTESYVPVSDLWQQLNANNRLRCWLGVILAFVALKLHGFTTDLILALFPIVVLMLSAWGFEKLYRRFKPDLTHKSKGLLHAGLTQSALDLVLLTVSMHSTGGAISPVAAFFIIYMGVIATLFPPRFLSMLIGLSVILYLSAVLVYIYSWLIPSALLVNVGLQATDSARWNIALIAAAAMLVNGVFVSVQSRHAYLRWKQADSQGFFLERMQKITTIGLENTESGDMYALLANLIREALDADCIYLTRVDEESGDVFSLAASGNSHSRYLALPPNTRNETTFTASVMRLGRPVVAEDSLLSPYVSARVALNFPERSALALPLVGLPSRHFFGALLVTFSHHPHYFSPEYIERAHQVADLTALLISRLRLHNEAVRRADLLEKFAAQVTALTSNLQQTTLLPAIVESARSLLGAQRAALHLLEAETHQLTCQYSTGLSSNYLVQMTHRFNQTLLARTLETQGVVLIPDVNQDSRTGPIQDLIALEKFRAYGVFSLQGQQGQIGALSLYWDKPHAISAEEVAVARLFAQRAVGLLHHAQLYARATEASLTDSLTGLANRRDLDLRLEEECLRVGQRIFSLLMIDLDGFKAVNDNFGHAIGDSVLQQVAIALQGAIRSADSVFRYGGDEFSVILPDTDLLQAVHVAQKINVALASTGLHLPNETQRYLTSCIGVASFPADAQDPRALLEKADLRMYRAKRQGGAAIVSSD